MSEEHPIPCPNCKSLDTRDTTDDDCRPWMVCNSCEYSFPVVHEAPEGPMRVGGKVGRTLYFKEKFIGHVDTNELAELIVTSVNASTQLFTDERLAELAAMAKEAELVLANVHQHAPATVLATYIKNLKQKVDGLIGEAHG